MSLIKKRSEELTALQKELNLDPNYMERGVLFLLLVRLATDEEWEDVIGYIRSDRQEKGKKKK